MVLTNSVPEIKYVLPVNES